jgi:hypothetical protein
VNFGGALIDSRQRAVGRVVCTLWGLVFFLLVETEKMIIRSWKLVRRTVAAAEAGA